jgi:hypothetical protein
VGFRSIDCSVGEVSWKSEKMNDNFEVPLCMADFDHLIQSRETPMHSNIHSDTRACLSNTRNGHQSSTASSERGLIRILTVKTNTKTKNRTLTK